MESAAGATSDETAKDFSNAKVVVITNVKPMK